MAEFEPSIQKTLIWEGGYANNPHDSGGETYRGISRKNWPSWAGWVIVDRYKDPTKVGILLPWKLQLDNDAELQGLVIDFYRQNFWQYDAINEQEVADKIFDLSVNVGTRHAVKIAQMAAGVLADGIFGPNTVNAINHHPYGSLLPTIRVAAENYHKQIVVTHPEDAEFLKGWLRRDDA